MSSIAAAGLYDGVFREDMFEEAEDLDHPYFKTKHDSEGIVRNECKRPFRIYRPGFVVGDSKTGYIDKIDGPYYFFKTLQKLRELLPPWMPTIGIEGGRINIVPVDFVADALDYLAHKKGLDGKCFHLTDPAPAPDRRGAQHLRQGRPRAADDDARQRADVRLHSRRRSSTASARSRRSSAMIRAVLTDLGIPKDVFQFINWPTRYDNREAAKALKGSGIAVPHARDLRGEAVGLLGAQPRSRTSSSTARCRAASRTRSSSSPAPRRASARPRRCKLAEAGAKVILVARGEEKLVETQARRSTPPGGKCWHLHVRRVRHGRRATRWSRGC